MLFKVRKLSNKTNFLVFDLATLGTLHVEELPGKHLIRAQNKVEHFRVFALFVMNLFVRWCL